MPLPLDLRSWLDCFGLWDGPVASVAFALVAPSAGYAGVVQGVGAPSAVGHYVVYLGAVRASGILIVELCSAVWTVVDAVF